MAKNNREKVPPKPQAEAAPAGEIAYDKELAVKKGQSIEKVLTLINKKAFPADTYTMTDQLNLVMAKQALDNIIRDISREKEISFRDSQIWEREIAKEDSGLNKFLTKIQSQFPAQFAAESSQTETKTEPQQVKISPSKERRKAKRAEDKKDKPEIKETQQESSSIEKVEEPKSTEILGQKPPPKSSTEPVSPESIPEIVEPGKIMMNSKNVKKLLKELSEALSLPNLTQAEKQYLTESYRKLDVISRFLKNPKGELKSSFQNFWDDEVSSEEEGTLNMALRSIEEKKELQIKSEPEKPQASVIQPTPKLENFQKVENRGENSKEEFDIRNESPEEISEVINEINNNLKRQRVTRSDIRFKALQEDRDAFRKIFDFLTGRRSDIKGSLTKKWRDYKEGKGETYQVLSNFRLSPEEYKTRSAKYFIDKYGRDKLNSYLTDLKKNIPTIDTTSEEGEAQKRNLEKLEIALSRLLAFEVDEKLFSEYGKADISLINGLLRFEEEERRAEIYEARKPIADLLRTYRVEPLRIARKNLEIEEVEWRKKIGGEAYNQAKTAFRNFFHAKSSEDYSQFREEDFNKIIWFMDNYFLKKEEPKKDEVALPEQINEEQPSEEFITIEKINALRWQIENRRSDIKQTQTRIFIQDAVYALDDLEKTYKEGFINGQARNFWIKYIDDGKFFERVGNLEKGLPFEKAMALDEPVERSSAAGPAPQIKTEPVPQIEVIETEEKVEAALKSHSETSTTSSPEPQIERPFEPGLVRSPEELPPPALKTETSVIKTEAMVSQKESREKRQVQIPPELEYLLNQSFEQLGPNTGLNRQTFKEISGFSQIESDPVKQIFVLDNVQHIWHKYIQEEAEKRHQKYVSEGFTFLGKIKRNLRTNKWLAKHHQDLINEGFNINNFKEEISNLIHIVAIGPKLTYVPTLNRRGEYDGHELRAEYIDADFIKQTDINIDRANAFNLAASHMASQPVEWDIKHLSRKEKKEFEKIKKEYEKQKSALIQELCLKYGLNSGTEAEALAAVNNIDFAVKMHQTLIQHPEIENELRKFADNKAFWGIGVKGVGIGVASRAGQSLARWGARVGAVASIGTWSVPIVGALVSSGFGYFRGREMGKKALEKRDRDIRERKIQASHSMTYAGEKRSATFDKNFVNADNLYTKLFHLRERLENTEDESKKLELEDALKARIFYTRRKLMDGEIIFGTQKEALAKKLSLIQEMSKAEVEVHISEQIKKGGRKLTRIEMLNRVLQKDKEEIEKKRKEYISQKGKTGAITGAAASLIGFAAADAATHALHEYVHNFLPAFGKVRGPAAALKLGDNTSKIVEEHAANQIAHEDIKNLAPSSDQPLLNRFKYNSPFENTEKLPSVSDSTSANPPTFNSPTSPPQVEGQAPSSTPTPYFPENTPAHNSNVANALNNEAGNHGTQSTPRSTDRISPNRNSRGNNSETVGTIFRRPEQSRIIEKSYILSNERQSRESSLIEYLVHEKKMPRRQAGSEAHRIIHRLFRAHEEDVLRPVHKGDAIIITESPDGKMTITDIPKTHVQEYLRSHQVGNNPSGIREPHQVIHRNTGTTTREHLQSRNLRSHGGRPTHVNSPHPLHTSHSVSHPGQKINKSLDSSSLPPSSSPRPTPSSTPFETQSFTSPSGPSSTPSPTPFETPSSIRVEDASPTPSITPTPSASPIETPTPTASSTPSSTSTPTSTPSPTASPTATETPTSTPEATSSPEPTVIPTPSPSPSSNPLAEKIIQDVSSTNHISISTAEALQEYAPESGDNLYSALTNILDTDERFHALNETDKALAFYKLFTSEYLHQSSSVYNQMGLKNFASLPLDSKLDLSVPLQNKPVIDNILANLNDADYIDRDHSMYLIENHQRIMEELQKADPSSMTKKEFDELIERVKHRPPTE